MGFGFVSKRDLRACLLDHSQYIWPSDSSVSSRAARQLTDVLTAVFRSEGSANLGTRGGVIRKQWHDYLG